MPFQEKYEERGTPAGLSALADGCSQIFHNIVVTPHDQLAACCGLTFEHIPELKMGDLNHSSMKELFDEGIWDFLKIWIHVEGPGTILRRLFGSEINEEFKNIHHICQACAIMHLDPRIRKELSLRYHQFVPEIISRFNLRLALHHFENQ